MREALVGWTFEHKVFLAVPTTSWDVDALLMSVVWNLLIFIAACGLHFVLKQGQR